MANAVDLSKLPPPDVVEELDYEQIRSEIIADLESRDPEYSALVESDPGVKVLETAAYRELGLRQRVNEAARAVLVAYSTGADLDQIAANNNVERLVIDEGDPEATPPVPPTMESDQSLRLRIPRAFEGISVAGPRSAYEFHALSADGQVADASATSPNPAEAVVSILSVDGDGTAPQTLLDTVEAALSAEDVRPLSDRLTVQSASIIDYAVDATLYLYPGPESEPVREAAEEALSDYVSEQRRIGRDIRLSAIYAALHVEGVQRVELASPSADVVISATEAANCTSVTVTVGGTDE